jgi:hypothetical protein
MPLTLKDLLLGMVVPALVAMLLSWAATRTAPVAAGKALLPMALVAGFLLGYWLLKLGPIVPTLDLDWMPYTTVLALVPALVPGGRRWSLPLVLVLLAVVCLVSAWLLVPSWPALRPLRPRTIGLWWAYSLLVAVSMWLLARREPVRGPPADDQSMAPTRSPRPVLLYLAMMLAVLATAFVLLAMSGSLRFAQTVAAGLAALAGVTATVAIRQGRPSLEGVALVYALLSTGMLLTGYMNSFSSIPLVSYLILPLAPWAYGLIPPSARSQPLRLLRLIVSSSIAMLICGLSLGLAIYAEYG